MQKVDLNHLSTYIASIRKGNLRKNPETKKKSVGFFYNYNIPDICSMDENDGFKKEMKKFKNLCKNNKIEVLEKAKKDYNMSEILYRKLKKSINYSTQNEQEELNNFILELPYALRNRMTLLIFSKKYQ